MTGMRVKSTEKRKNYKKGRIYLTPFALVRRYLDQRGRYIYNRQYTFTGTARASNARQRAGPVPIASWPNLAPLWAGSPRWLPTCPRPCPPKPGVVETTPRVLSNDYHAAHATIGSPNAPLQQFAAKESLRAARCCSRSRGAREAPKRIRSLPPKAEKIPDD